jgi:hypothetical protein
LVLSAKVAPEPPSARPFQAEQKGATASRVNRALYGRNKVMCGTKITKVIDTFNSELGVDSNKGNYQECPEKST